MTHPVDGFRLAYERIGHGPAVVLPHGWPGDRTDYRDVVPLLSSATDVVVPDLRGFGESDKHRAEPAAQYSADAQARSVVGLIEELGLDQPVIGGYDVGSRIAQTVARSRPDLVRALVVSPPLPGIGDRILTPQAQQEFWYQPFHQLGLADHLLDGRPEAVRAYLRHFWSHWSGPDYELADDHLDHLVSVYAGPGAFTASIGWYRAGGGAVARSVAEWAPQSGDRIAVPATVLWPEHDPLFPRAWSDRLDDFFVNARLQYIDGPGHFTPLESPPLRCGPGRGSGNHSFDVTARRKLGVGLATGVATARLRNLSARAAVRAGRATGHRQHDVPCPGSREVINSQAVRVAARPPDRWCEGGGAMIVRTWRGWVGTDQAVAYVEFIDRTGLNAYRETTGNLGAQMWTRDLGDGRTEVITVSWWRSRADIEGFAGQNIDAAVFYPEDDGYLIDRETTVQHYDVRQD